MESPVLTLTPQINPVDSSANQLAEVSNIQRHKVYRFAKSDKWSVYTSPPQPLYGDFPAITQLEHVK